MSYLVLARKYRPRSFSEVVGQEHITKTLKNALRLNKVSHAYLFSGQRGVGKTTTARIFAKAVNCPNTVNQEPCGECEICREIENSASVDIIEIDAASNRGIDEIRELRENIKYAPAKCKYKIYIIDEVHMLTNQAFNAILKTLEEPPPHIIFIMATTEPDKVLQTITSRCQTFNFKPINESEIISGLKEIAEKEKTSYEDGGLALIARAAGGSMRDAQSIMDQALSFGDGKITAEDTANLLGIVPSEFLFELSGYISKQDPAGALRRAAELYSQGYSPSRLHQDLMEHFRNLMMTKVFKKENEFLGFDADHSERLIKESENFKEERLLWITDLLEKNAFRLKQSDTPRIVMDTILFKLCEEFVSFEDVIKVAGDPVKKSDPERKKNAKNEKPKSKLASRPDEARKKGSKWKEILDLIHRESPALFHTLKGARAVLKDKQVIIEYPSLLEIKGKKADILKDKIHKVLGEEFSFSLQKKLKPETKKKDIKKPPRRFSPVLIEQEDPVVAKIVEEFNGQIEEQYKKEK